MSKEEINPFKFNIILFWTFIIGLFLLFYGYWKNVFLGVLIFELVCIVIGLLVYLILALYFLFFYKGGL